MKTAQSHHRCWCHSPRAGAVPCEGKPSPGLRSQLQAHCGLLAQWGIGCLTPAGKVLPGTSKPCPPGTACTSTLPTRPGCRPGLGAEPPVPPTPCRCLWVDSQPHTVLQPDPEPQAVRPGCCGASQATERPACPKGTAPHLSKSFKANCQERLAALRSIHINKYFTQRVAVPVQRNPPQPRRDRSHVGREFRGSALGTDAPAGSRFLAACPL